jgi:hypothetical protein
MAGYCHWLVGRIHPYLLRIMIKHTSSQKRREITVKSGFRSG